MTTLDHRESWDSYCFTASTSSLIVMAFTPGMKPAGLPTSVRGSIKEKWEGRAGLPRGASLPSERASQVATRQPGRREFAERIVGLPQRPSQFLNVIIEHDRAEHRVLTA